MDAPKTVPPQTGVAAFDFISITEANSRYPLAAFDARMKGRFFKLQAHKLFPGYESLVWIDANVQIKSSAFLAPLLAALDKTYDIAMARHPSRNCVYEEADFITQSISKGSEYLKARYEIEPITKQVEAYRAAGHPRNSGLWWCGLFARRLTPHVNRFFDAVWDHCLTWSNYDQNAFAFLSRVCGIRINPIDWGGFYNNPTYNLVPHLKVQ